MSCAQMPNKSWITLLRGKFMKMNITILDSPTQDVIIIFYSFFSLSNDRLAKSTLPSPA